MTGDLLPHPPNGPILASLAVLSIFGSTQRIRFPPPPLFPPQSPVLAAPELPTGIWLARYSADGRV